jgi:hypothetical protein
MFSYTPEPHTCFRCGGHRTRAGNGGNEVRCYGDFSEHEYELDLYNIFWLLSCTVKFNTASSPQPLDMTVTWPITIPDDSPFNIHNIPYGIFSDGQNVRISWFMIKGASVNVSF